MGKDFEKLWEDVNARKYLEEGLGIHEPVSESLQRFVESVVYSRPLNRHTALPRLAKSVGKPPRVVRRVMDNVSLVAPGLTESLGGRIVRRREIYRREK